MVGFDKLGLKRIFTKRSDARRLALLGIVTGSMVAASAAERNRRPDSAATGEGQGEPVRPNHQPTARGGKWSAGPTGALVYSDRDSPWFAGILVTQLWSIAGTPRAAVNQTSTEVDLSYNFESGWYIQTDPIITYDWSATPRQALALPVGIDVGKVTKIGGQEGWQGPRVGAVWKPGDPALISLPGPAWLGAR